MIPQPENDLHTCPKCGGSNFTSRGLLAHQPYCTGEPEDLPPTTVIAVNPVNPVKTSGKTQRMESPLTLTTLAERANEAIEIISRHESAFEAATLEHRLIIGQQMAIAQQAFGLTFDERASVAGQISAAVRSGLAAEAAELERTGGFGGWLALNCPRLPRPTAIKYATAFRGLALPLDASKEDVFLRIDALRKGIWVEGLPDRTAELAAQKSALIASSGDTTAAAPLSLADLYRAGKPSREEAHASMVAAARKCPGYDPEMRLRDAREFFFAVMEEQVKDYVDRGYLDALDRPGLERMKKFQMWLRDRILARLDTVDK